MTNATAALLDENLRPGTPWELSQESVDRLKEVLRESAFVPRYVSTPMRGYPGLPYNGLEIILDKEAYRVQFGLLSSEDDMVRLAPGIESSILLIVPPGRASFAETAGASVLTYLTPAYPNETDSAPGFEPNEWSNYPAANCFGYALNLKLNQSIHPLGKRNSMCKKSMNGERYRCALIELGLFLWSNNTPPGRGHFIALYLKGQSSYHFTRLDKNGYWSSKLENALPTEEMVDGRYITNPYQRPREKYSDLDSFYFVPEGFNLPDGIFDA